MIYWLRKLIDIKYQIYIINYEKFINRSFIKRRVNKGVKAVYPLNGIGTFNLWLIKWRLNIWNSSYNFNKIILS